MSLTYRQAGVDMDAGDALVERIKPLARSTRIAEVLADVGGFAGLCAVPSGLKEPILVSGTDGVGTKLKLAFALNRHDTIGIDLVAMSVNDVLTTGARPLFFLDYFACGKLHVDTAEQVIAGIARGCREASCALLGGETAELPGMYADGEYDLAGFAVGIVDKQALLGPARVRAGDVLIALPSSGLHSNGYSLARHVVERGLGLALSSHVTELGGPIGEVLLTPTRIYTRAMQTLTNALGPDLHAACHVTGGGIEGNLPRILPENTRAEIELLRPRPAVFDFIQRGGPVAEAEMRRTFNLGVGFIAVVAEARANDAIQSLQLCSEPAWLMGKVVTGTGEASVSYVGES